MLTLLRRRAGLLLSAMRLLAGMLVPYSAGAAVTVDEFPWGRIYSSETSDGVSVFTDIEPPELRPASVGLANGVEVIPPRAKVVAVKAANVAAKLNPRPEGHAGFTPPEAPVEENPPPRED